MWFNINLLSLSVGKKKGNNEITRNVNKRSSNAHHKSDKMTTNRKKKEEEEKKFQNTKENDEIDVKKKAINYLIVLCRKKKVRKNRRKRHAQIYTIQNRIIKSAIKTSIFSSFYICDCFVHFFFFFLHYICDYTIFSITFHLIICVCFFFFFRGDKMYMWHDTCACVSLSHAQQIIDNNILFLLSFYINKSNRWFVIKSLQFRIASGRRRQIEFVDSTLLQPDKGQETMREKKKKNALVNCTFRNEFWSRFFFGTFFCFLFRCASSLRTFEASWFRVFFFSREHFSFRFTFCCVCLMSSIARNELQTDKKTH